MKVESELTGQARPAHRLSNQSRNSQELFRVTLKHKIETKKVLTCSTAAESVIDCEHIESDVQPSVKTLRK